MFSVSSDQYCCCSGVVETSQGQAGPITTPLILFLFCKLIQHSLHQSIYLSLLLFCSLSTLSFQGDSGSVDHAQRFSEQLILCAKAATILRLGCRWYHIQVASSSSTLDSTDLHRNGEYLKLQCAKF